MHESEKWKWSRSVLSNSATSWTAAYQAPLSIGFSRQEIAGRNINNLRYADDTTLMTESEEGLKSLMMKVKEESEKAGLKLNIKKN